MGLVANHAPFFYKRLETRRGELLQVQAAGVFHDGAPSSEIERLIASFVKDHMNRDIRQIQAVGSAHLLDNAEDPQNKALVVIRPSW